MGKPDKTVFVIDRPIADPEDKTVATYEFRGSLSELRGITIDVSREVKLPVLLAHLQRMWDSELQRLARSAHQGTETA